MHVRVFLKQVQLLCTIQLFLQARQPRKSTMWVQQKQCINISVESVNLEFICSRMFAVTMLPLPKRPSHKASTVSSYPMPWGTLWMSVAPLSGPRILPSVETNQASRVALPVVSSDLCIFQLMSKIQVMVFSIFSHQSSLCAALQIWSMGNCSRVQAWRTEGTGWIHACLCHGCHELPLNSNSRLMFQYCTFYVVL